jgi:lysophospholipase
MSAKMPETKQTDAGKIVQTRFEAADEHWKSTAEESAVTATDGINIRFALLDIETPNALVVIANGRTESYLKYKDLAHQLNLNGYAVLLYDHRGQGLSDRMLSDPLKGYVRSFEDYVGDLKLLFETQVVTQNPAKTILLTHSMGGTVAALYATKFPCDFDALVLSSPMLGLPGSLASKWLANAIEWIESALLRRFGREPGYIPGFGQYSPIPFERNGITHSRERFENIGTLVRDNPDIALGDPTTHWVYESFLAFDEIFANLAALKTPILLLQAGAEKIVSNSAQNRFCTKLSTICQSGKPLVIDRARHELLNESDQYRLVAIETILDFIADICRQR